jgi:hypothetical protein
MKYITIRKFIPSKKQENAAKSIGMQVDRAPSSG